MITKEITLCGKQVTLGYCYATEIAYKDLSDEDITNYIQQAIEAVQQQKDPDIKHTIFAILACMLAYYQSVGKDTPVKDTELMNEAKPAELGMAIFAILDLRAQFYHVPKDEPKDEPAEGTEEGGAKN